MGFLGNLIGNAVSQTVNKTVSNVVSDATSRASESMANSIKAGAKTAFENSKAKMRAKVLEGATAYRDNPMGKVDDKGQNIVLFASDKKITYRMNGKSYKVDAVGCITWNDKENTRFAELDPGFYADTAFNALQEELDRLASEGVEPTKVAIRLPNILANINTETSTFKEKVKFQYNHNALLSIMLLELPDLEGAESYSGTSTSASASTHVCPYCGTTFEGNVCTHCGSALEE